MALLLQVEFNLPPLLSARRLHTCMFAESLRLSTRSSVHSVFHTCGHSASWKSKTPRTIPCHDQSLSCDCRRRPHRWLHCYLSTQNIQQKKGQTATLNRMMRRHPRFSVKFSRGFVNFRSTKLRNGQLDNGRVSFGVACNRCLGGGVVPGAADFTQKRARARSRTNARTNGTTRTKEHTGYRGKFAWSVNRWVEAVQCPL